MSNSRITFRMTKNPVILEVHGPDGDFIGFYKRSLVEKKLGEKQLSKMNKMMKFTDEPVGLDIKMELLHECEKELTEIQGGYNENE